MLLLYTRVCVGLRIVVVYDYQIILILMLNTSPLNSSISIHPYIIYLTSPQFLCTLSLTFPYFLIYTTIFSCKMKCALSLWLIAMVLFVSSFPWTTNGYENMVKSSVEIHGGAETRCGEKRQPCPRPQRSTDMVVQIKKKARTGPRGSSSSSAVCWKSCGSGAYWIITFSIFVFL